MALTQDQIADLVLLTWEKLVKAGAFLDLQTDLTDHVAVREMWKGRKKVFQGGLDWRFDVQTDHNHAARFVGLYETDGSALIDTMVSGTVPVRHANTHYVYDLREPSFQQGGRQIVDFLMTKNVASQVSLFELLEDALWGKPVDSDDKTTPFGIQYWITRNATTGFNGGNPSGFTDGRAGISSATYSRWANWTDQYVQVNKTDLVRRMREAHAKTKFRSPVSHAQPDVGPMRNGIYSKYSVIQGLEETIEEQNMNLGNDLASKDGRATFKGTPLTYAPKLDDDSGDPVYMLDWKWLAVGCLAGWENNQTAPYMVPDKHQVRRVDVDCSLNMICTNLRRQAVIYK